MLIYKQRYKPRTSRAYTKSDLTVYDSAGNTALNALTIFGKSEVVDGSIKSAGEGWNTVDLGTLNWYKSDNGRMFSPAQNYIKKPADAQTLADILCPAYAADTDYNVRQLVHDNAIAIGGDNAIYIYDSNFTDPATFKTAMSGVILAYKQTTPTNNTIAVKTDNGYGIDGTMAVFETGTPLRGIPDADVRDVMQWDGSAGTVTKNCAKVRLADLTWHYNTTSSLNPFFWTYTSSFPSGNIKYRGVYSTTLYNLICSKYQVVMKKETTFINKTLTVDGSLNTVSQLQIKDTDYTTVEDFVASLGDAELVYELATPTTEQLTTAENASIAGLRTFEPQTHAQNNAQTDMTVDYTIRVPTN